MSIRAVIVDDEPLARERIRHLLAGEGDVEVVAECRDGQEAVAAIRELRPDLVFLDVQMPEMDGFEVIAELASSVLPIVVFVTAYDQYAVRAFQVAALDYLLKPFDAQRFRDALARVREQIGRREGSVVSRRVLDLLEEIESRRRVLQRFVVRSAGRITFVSCRDVDCIEADGNYMRLHAGERAHLIRETMDGLERKLDPTKFVRIHRSWIVNIDRIQELQPWFHGSYAVVLRGGRKILAGRTYRRTIERLLGADE